jgi:hypothetical protein
MQGCPRHSASFTVSIPLPFRKGLESTTVSSPTPGDSTRAVFPFKVPNLWRKNQYEESHKHDSEHCRTTIRIAMCIDSRKTIEFFHIIININNNNNNKIRCRNDGCYISIVTTRSPTATATTARCHLETTQITILCDFRSRIDSNVSTNQNELSQTGQNLSSRQVWFGMMAHYYYVPQIWCNVNTSSYCC